ncbi:hypothetical protein R5R35_005014 [Gryllus longicercus]|uniref:Reelin domain-containing protein n=1 Tax=Gryllus longicercus TaxID=2509291 RepID=A0AAN9Z7U5_9ORTH
MQFGRALVTLAALAVCGVAAFPAEPEIRFTSTPAPGTTELDPNHVPDSVCVSMQPAHGPNEPKKTDPPYVVTVSSRKVSKGDTVRVVVKGLASETFKGIYIQGRINDLPVGRWLPHDNPQVRVLDCSPRKENALSFVSRNGINSITLEWVAPEDVKGDLIFLTTIVKSYDAFWTKVRSTPLQVL